MNFSTVCQCLVADLKDEAVMWMESYFRNSLNMVIKIFFLNIITRNLKYQTAFQYFKFFYLFF